MFKTKTAKIILGILAVFVLIGIFDSTKANAQYSTSCSDLYGINSYETLSGDCACMSGYVFGEGVLGDTQCVSASSVCRDKYGYNSRYDSLSNSCECSVGYVLGTNILGETECISEDRACKNQYGSNARSTYGGSCECRSGYGFQDVGGSTQCVSYENICYDRLGINSTYDSLADSCGCLSGYELTQKEYTSGLECKSCSTKYGRHSSWSYSAEECECDDGYTLKDGECVEKENNVYFELLDIDEGTDEIIVESKYGNERYLIEHGFGCGFWIDSYVGDDIVLGLGTDFNVDWGDRIVLQNHDATCDIRGVEDTRSESFNEKESDTVHIPYTPPSNDSSNATGPSNDFEQGTENEKFQIKENTNNKPENEQKLEKVESEKDTNISTASTSDTTTENTSSNEKRESEAESESFISKIINFFKNLF